MFPNTETKIVLASGSVSRAALLRGAGIAFDRDPADIDEAAVRAALAADGGAPDPADVAEILARTKAETVSARRPGALVIGADQIMTLDGEIFEKPPTMEAARATLLKLRGRTHQLHAGVCAARDGETIWSHTDTAVLTMRTLSPETVGQYLAAAGDDVLASVGAYQLEGLGVHLFSKVEGDYFTILGLPLLPLFEFLRAEGVLVP
ncbi:MAG: Maf family nucleotide pyrophosphatase [Methyloligellaceae bacterium]